MKINWKNKLTSRKFWAAIIGFVTSILLAFGLSDHIVAEVTGIVMSGATCIAYIIGEGMVDAVKTDGVKCPDAPEINDGDAL